MAYCYDPRRPDQHPPSQQADCARGLVRATVDVSGICVDGGMYLGARAFLQIDPDGRFTAWEKRLEKSTKWSVRPLNEPFCTAR
jgi:hypothetical protein